MVVFDRSSSSPSAAPPLSCVWLFFQVHVTYRTVKAHIRQSTARMRQSRLDSGRGEEANVLKIF